METLTFRRYQNVCKCYLRYVGKCFLRMQHYSSHFVLCSAILSVCRVKLRWLIHVRYTRGSIRAFLKRQRHQVIQTEMSSKNVYQKKGFEGPRGFVIRIDLNVCCYVWLVFLCTCVEWPDKYLTKSANFAGRVPLFDNEASLTMFSAVHLGVEWYQMGN